MKAKQALLGWLACAGLALGGGGIAMATTVPGEIVIGQIVTINGNMINVGGKIFPIAAGDVFFETPAWAAFAAGIMNALPMWRKKFGPHALQELRQRLVEEPCAYILFPEGARSRDRVGRPKAFRVWRAARPAPRQLAFRA